VSRFATERLPQPMAVDGETTHDPATRSVLVRVSGVGASFWRRGHTAMMQAEESGRYGARSVWAHALGRRDIARGEPVRDGWLRFQLSDADYRKLVNTPDLSAIVTVDREAGRILGVKFLGTRLG
jgi:hypothetical protein